MTTENTSAQSSKESKWTEFLRLVGILTAALTLYKLIDQNDSESHKDLKTLNRELQEQIEYKDDLIEQINKYTAVNPDHPELFRLNTQLQETNAEIADLKEQIVNEEIRVRRAESKVGRLIAFGVLFTSVCCIAGVFLFSQKNSKEDTENVQASVTAMFQGVLNEATAISAAQATLAQEQFNQGQTQEAYLNSRAGELLGTQAAIQADIDSLTQAAQVPTGTPEPPTATSTSTSTQFPTFTPTLDLQYFEQFITTGPNRPSLFTALEDGQALDWGAVVEGDQDPVNDDSYFERMIQETFLLESGKHNPLNSVLHILTSSFKHQSEIVDYTKPDHFGFGLTPETVRKFHQFLNAQSVYLEFVDEEKLTSWIRQEASGGNPTLLVDMLWLTDFAEQTDTRHSLEYPLTRWVYDEGMSEQDRALLRQNLMSEVASRVSQNYRWSQDAFGPYIVLEDACLIDRAPQEPQEDELLTSHFVDILTGDMEDTDADQVDYQKVDGGNNGLQVSSLDEDMMEAYVLNNPTATSWQRLEALKGALRVGIVTFDRREDRIPSAYDRSYDIDEGNEEDAGFPISCGYEIVVNTATPVSPPQQPTSSSTPERGTPIPTNPVEPTLTPGSTPVYQTPSPTESGPATPTPVQYVPNSSGGRAKAAYPFSGRGVGKIQ